MMMMHAGGNPVFCSTLAAGKAISRTIKVVVSHRAVSGLRSRGTAGALGTGVWVLQDTVAGWKKRGHLVQHLWPGKLAGRAHKPN